MKISEEETLTFAASLSVSVVFLEELKQMPDMVDAVFGGLRMSCYGVCSMSAFMSANKQTFLYPAIHKKLTLTA